ncbi:DUF4288 domain-containing protein [Cyclobacterium sediminis]
MKELLKGWKISIDEAKHSEKLAEIEVNLEGPCMDDSELIQIPPETRVKLWEATLQKAYASLKNDFKLINPINVSGTRRQPYTVMGKIVLQSVFYLRDKNYVRNFNIKSIEGVAAKKEKQTAVEAATTDYYSVKARFGILIEGQTSGLQGYEDRVVLIKAVNENEAEEKAIKLLPTLEKPYLNGDKRFVWFKFEKVLDVVGYSNIDTIEPFSDGMEIYYEWKNRRIKPENVWILKYRKEE